MPTYGVPRIRIALRLRAEVRPFVDTWTERFAANNLLTYSSAIALQLFVALAALLFLAVALPS